MTVRTWFTISAIVLVALVVAVGLKLFAPVPPPTIVARAGEVRVPGVLRAACWPQRNGSLRCDKGSDEKPQKQIKGKGTIRFVVAYPAKPERVTLTAHVPGRERALISRGKTTLRYSKKGVYRILVNARYAGNAYVTYYFGLMVT